MAAFHEKYIQARFQHLLSALLSAAVALGFSRVGGYRNARSRRPQWALSDHCEDLLSLYKNTDILVSFALLKRLLIKLPCIEIIFEARVTGAKWKRLRLYFIFNFVHNTSENHTLHRNKQSQMMNRKYRTRRYIYYTWHWDV